MNSTYSVQFLIKTYGFITFCIGLEKKSLILTHEFTINLLLTNSPQLRVLFVPKQNYLPPVRFTDNHATSFSKSFSQVVQSSNLVKYSSSTCKLRTYT